MLHYAYGSVKKSINAYMTKAGGHVIEVQLHFPIISNKEIMMELGKRNGRKVRMAVIDHITFMPSVVITVKELTIICRKEGMDQDSGVCGCCSCHGQCGGQPHRNSLTTGWNAFVKKKKLVSGNVVLFLRGVDGELRLGIRRASQFKKNMLFSVHYG
ncbi:hypothetical protein ZOSMA_493G00020 [Zostera marina]|uniref:TF-B3 domain-containing protein n=1 Tax=Zostera marina TaxID=29655 RepID=A0A0K9P1H0_ZOSMR|nr:hypothetical protein ZOSMA_493G00020 [Zostera marina]